MTPLVTVLMPVYNGQLFLKESIDSILQQRYQHFELLIIDDGSTDNTPNIIRQFTDKRIRYVRNDVNLKIIKTLNKGLDLAQGKYIVRMDADDIALPDRIALQVALMERDPDIVLCGSNINRFSESYSIIDKRGGNDDVIRAKLLFDTAVNHPSAIIRKEALTRNGLQYSEQYLHTEDYALWYELSQLGKIVNIDEVLLRYRMHGNNLSMQHSQLQYQNMNRMRIRILKDFLTKSDAADIDELMLTYQKLLQLNTVSFTDMQAMDQLLTKVVEINQSSKVYDDWSLKKAASWFWYVVFTHENCQRFSWNMINAFLWNKKSIAQYLEPVYRRKLLVKSLLNWTKK